MTVIGDLVAVQGRGIEKSVCISWGSDDTGRFLVSVGTGGVAVLDAIVVATCTCSSIIWYAVYVAGGADVAAVVAGGADVAAAVVVVAQKRQCKDRSLSKRRRLILKRTDQVRNLEFQTSFSHFFWIG